VHPSDKTVGGVIEAENWTVPKGETLTVEARGLTVFAKRNITVDGTLKIDPGSRIAFFAKVFAVHPTGRIEAILTPNGVRTAVKSVNDVISACLFRNGQLNDSPGFAQIVIPSGDNLYLTSSSPIKDSGCQLRTYTGIGLEPGRVGNFALAGLHDGEPAGNLEIGTPTAIAMTKRASREAGVVKQAYAYGYVMILNRIFPATGGAGANDLKGVFSPPSDTWSFHPGNGGRGGNVSIVTGTADALTIGGLVTAGTGGAGGGFDAASLNGTEAEPNAENLSVVQSSGGAGGSVNVTANSIDGTLVFRGGSGGAPGPASAAGGDGYSDQYSGVGNGGNVTLSLGRVGKAGTGPANGADGTFPAMTFSGGTVATPATCCAAGGLGGTFTLTRNPGVPPLPNGASVVLDAFGTGGYGASGYSAGPPCTPGYNGGKGGDLYNIGKELVSLVNGSFDGGDGGGGTPPGNGGPGGMDHYLGTQIGSNGVNGTPC
jgi:hypothetical protein